MGIDRLDVIIPAAGCGSRLGRGQPKGLISLGTETVIQRQIRIVRSVIPNSRIIVVGGYKYDRLYKSLPFGTSFVINKEFQESNVAHSIKIGLEHTQTYAPALVIYGDLVFNEETLTELPSQSAVFVEDEKKREDEVGVAEMNGRVLQFAFGLPTKWTHIALLQPAEKALFLSSCVPIRHQRYLGYEILNDIVEHGGQFVTHRPKNMRLVEIDTAKDLHAAQEFINEDSLQV